LAEGCNRVFSLSVPTNATDWAIVDRFHIEESVARHAIFQAAKGYTSLETTKSWSMNRAHREESFQALVGNFPVLPLKVFMETILTFFD
jgi:hypothetical protein